MADASEEEFKQAIKRLEEASLSFQQTLIILQEAQVQFAQEVAQQGLSIRAQQLRRFIDSCIKKLKKEEKIEEGYLSWIKY